MLGSYQFVEKKVLGLVQIIFVRRMVYGKLPIHEFTVTLLNDEMNYGQLVLD